MSWSTPHHAVLPSYSVGMRDLLTTITTTPERLDAAFQVADQLEAFGLTPLVNLSIPTPNNDRLRLEALARIRRRGYETLVTGNPEKGYGGRNNSRAFKAAYETAFERGMDILYCEDDILFASDFPFFFEEARSIPEAGVWFYTHDHRAEENQARRYGIETWSRLKEAARYKQPFRPKGLYKVRDASRLNSGQCFHLPWNVLDALPLHELQASSSPVDRWTQDRVERAGVPILVALPHPVQHLVNRDGREPPKTEVHRRRKTSMSFDLR